jgi:hypothetical protein
MYRINYSAGKGETKVLMISQKKDNHWVEIRSNIIIQAIELKHFKLTHFNQDSPKVGYGEFFLTNQLNFITGRFEFPDLI